MLPFDRENRVIEPTHCSQLCTLSAQSHGLRRIVTAFACIIALPLGCKRAFIAERAIVNGGKPVENPLVMQASIPLRPTETTLRWAGNGGAALDRQGGSNMAILYYGHKEKMERVKAPFLTLSATIRDGSKEAAEMAYDEPPPKRLKYRLRISNIGSADYKGSLDLVDQLPAEVRYVGVDDVKKRELIWLPYIGTTVATKSVDGWRIEPKRGGMGTRIRWSVDDIELEPDEWITIDLEFEPSPFGVSKER